MRKRLNNKRSCRHKHEEEEQIYYYFKLIATIFLSGKIVKMAYFALLWKARTIERYRLDYENEKLNSIMLANAKVPNKSMYQKFRHYRHDMKKRIISIFRRFFPEGTTFSNFLFYLKTDQTFPNFVWKSVLGFIAGIILTYLFFMFFVFQLSISLVHATIMSSIIGVLLTLGLAFSYRIRCLVFLLIPQFFSRVGRYTLTCYALVLILTGPATNTLRNSEVLSESMACGQEQLKTSVKQITDSVKKPFNSMKDTIKRLIDSVRGVAAKFKETLLKIHRLVLSIVRVMESGFSWLSSTVNICNKKVGTPYERCTRSLGDGVLDCRARLGPYFSWLCNLVYVAKAACVIVKPLDVICVLVEFVKGTIVATIKRKLRTFSNHVKTMLYVDVHVHHSYSFSSNSSRSASQVAAGIVTEIRHRAEPLLTWLSWSSCVTSLFLLLIIFRAKYYQHMFDTRSRFDNRYVTKQLRDLDLKRARENRDTVLPFNRREQAKYVTTTSFRLVTSERLYLARSAVFMVITTFKLLVHMVADYSLYWVLMTIRYHGRFQSPIQPGTPDAEVKVEGEGTVAKMLRSLIDSLGMPVASAGPSPISCLPDPYAPDMRRYTQIGILILLLWFSVFFEPYGLRLRHVVMGHYRPERAKARAIWLYNHILRTRGGFLKLARRKLRRDYKYSSEKKFTFRQWLDANITCWWLRSLLGTGSKDSNCLLCGDTPNTDDPESQFIRCQTPDCPGNFCASCFSDIGQTCTICMSPVDYGDLSDVSLEKGSSAESSATEHTDTDAEGEYDVSKDDSFANKDTSESYNSEDTPREENTRKQINKNEKSISKENVDNLENESANRKKVSRVQRSKKTMENRDDKNLHMLLYRPNLNSSKTILKMDNEKYLTNYKNILKYPLEGKVYKNEHKKLKVTIKDVNIKASNCLSEENMKCCKRTVELDKQSLDHLTSLSYTKELASTISRTGIDNECRTNLCKIHRIMGKRKLYFRRKRHKRQNDNNDTNKRIFLEDQSTSGSGSGKDYVSYIANCKHFIDNKNGEDIAKSDHDQADTTRNSLESFNIESDNSATVVAIKNLETPSKNIIKDALSKTITKNMASKEEKERNKKERKATKPWRIFSNDKHYKREKKSEHKVHIKEEVNVIGVKDLNRLSSAPTDKLLTEEDWLRMHYQKEVGLLPKNRKASYDRMNDTLRDLKILKLKRKSTELKYYPEKYRVKEPVQTLEWHKEAAPKYCRCPTTSCTCLGHRQYEVDVTHMPYKRRHLLKNGRIAKFIKNKKKLFLPPPPARSLLPHLQTAFDYQEDTYKNMGRGEISRNPEHCFSRCPPFFTSKKEPKEIRRKKTPSDFRENFKTKLRRNSEKKKEEEMLFQNCRDGCSPCQCHGGTNNSSFQEYEQPKQVLMVASTSYEQPLFGTLTSDKQVSCDLIFTNENNPNPSPSLVGTKCDSGEVHHNAEKNVSTKKEKEDSKDDENVKKCECESKKITITATPNEAAQKKWLSKMNIGNLLGGQCKSKAKMSKRRPTLKISFSNFNGIKDTIYEACGKMFNAVLTAVDGDNPCDVIEKGIGIVPSGESWALFEAKENAIRNIIAEGLGMLPAVIPCRCDDFDEKCVCEDEDQELRKGSEVHFASDTSGTVSCSKTTIESVSEAELDKFNDFSYRDRQ